MKKWLIAFLLIILSAAWTWAQDRPQPVDANEQKLVVNAIADVLAKQYVYPDTARKMGDLIRKNLKAGRYAPLDDPIAFAAKLTADLRSVSRARHLGVRFAPERILEMKTPDEAKRKAADERER